MEVETKMKPERKSYIDNTSGVKVTQLTDYKGHSHHFYFTNPGWYANGRKLLFSSDRNNHTNLFGVELGTGEIDQLTDLEPVPLPREIYFMTACKNPEPTRSPRRWNRADMLENPLSKSLV